MLLLNSFLSEGGDSELLLNVGVIVGLPWLKLIFSLELLFGDIRAGKLKVFVH